MIKKPIPCKIGIENLNTSSLKYFLLWVKKTSRAENIKSFSINNKFFCETFLSNSIIAILSNAERVNPYTIP